MTNDELKDALDGLFAYDTGSTDSGIHDEQLRQRCINELTRRLDAGDGSTGRLLRDMWLIEEAVAQSCHEGLIAFERWLDERMGIEMDSLR